MVLGGGRVLFDNDIQPSKGMRASKSASDLIHSIISEGVFYETDSDPTPSGIEDWDEENVKPSGSTGMRASKSASDLIHSIISEGVFYEKDSDLTPSEIEDWDEEHVKPSGSVHKHEQLGSFQCNDPMCKWRPRLWQVLPLLKRLSMEYPIEWKEVIVLPVSYLILSAWGGLGSDTSPIQRFTVRNKCLGVTYI